MIRFLRAFSWLRWRLLVNGLRGGHRRDTVERVSRAVGLVVPVLLVLMALMSIVSSTTLGFYLGWTFRGVGVDNRARTEIILRAFLLVATIMAVMIPMFIGVRGGSGRFARLLLLPISRHALHFAEVASSLTDPWIVFVLPGLLSFGIGRVAAGFFQTGRYMNGDQPYQLIAASPLDGLPALAGAIGMAFVLASLGTLVSFLIGWLVRDRRRSEMFVLLFVLAISALSVVPPLLTAQFADGVNQSADPTPAETFSLTGRLPAWTQVLPSELYAETLAIGKGRQQTRPWLHVGFLFLEGLALYGASSLVHRQLVGSVEGSRAHRRGALPGERPARRVAWLSPVASAIAWTQARTALRSVRGRLVVLLPGPLTAGLVVISHTAQHIGRFDEMLQQYPYVALGFGLLFGLYAAQAFTMNQFGSDRAGLTLQFLAPVTDVDLVRGKAAGCAMVFALGGAITTVCTLVASPGGSAFSWIATILGGAATFFVISPIAAWFSAFFPVASDLSKTGAGGNPHTIAMLAGTVLVAVAAVPAALILALLSPTAALPAMAWWLVLTAAIASPLLRVAAGAVNMRRENLALVAQGR